jgi:hypothetical protein
MIGLESSQQLCWYPVFDAKQVLAISDIVSQPQASSGLGGNPINIIDDLAATHYHKVPTS